MEEKNLKTIGIIGGMSWESTVPYYQIINRTIKAELGGFHSAKILLYSVDFAEIEHYQSTDQWDKSADVLADVALRLQNAGADFIVIATNTMHKVVPQIQQRIRIPILHIAEVTAATLLANKISKVGLLGTKYTLTQDFYKSKIIEAGIEVLVPNETDIEIVNDVIYNELCCGQISPVAKKKFLAIIDRFAANGAQGVILGCTEIGMLIKQEDTHLPVFDTTYLHARKAALMSVCSD